MSTLVYVTLLVGGLALVGYAVVRAVLGGVVPGGGGAVSRGSAGDGRRTLDERYAAGELNTEEYRRRADGTEGGA